MITNLRSRFALNPVTLKELRQMVRSRLVSTGLIAFLFLQVAVVSIALLTARSASSDPLGQSYGNVVFGTVTAMLGFMLLLGIPGFVSARMAAERSADRLDLQFTTALAPTQFIDGKIAAAAVLMLLFASTSLPFLMLAYLLRGVDVFTMLRSFGFLLVLALCVCHVVLFLGSIRLSKALRMLQYGLQRLSCRDPAEGAHHVAVVRMSVAVELPRCVGRWRIRGVGSRRQGNGFVEGVRS